MVMNNSFTYLYKRTCLSFYNRNCFFCRYIPPLLGEPPLSVVCLLQLQITLQSYLLSLRSFLENVFVVFALDICRFCQCLTAYLVRPILEYGSSAWYPYTDKLQEELEKVQNCAARFLTRNYVYETGSMTGILGQLKWESLKKGRKDNRLILLYKGLKGKALIPTDDLLPKTRHGRNQHSLAFQILFL